MACSRRLPGLENILESAVAEDLTFGDFEDSESKAVPEDVQQFPRLLVSITLSSLVSRAARFGPFSILKLLKCSQGSRP